MTSTIKVNNIQNQCGANIINESSNTITIGASGDTVSLASGASQTGFGRTGTVDWQTGSIKTATFTAANGEGYFCNTSGGAFTMNLPAGVAGYIVSVQDYNNTFDSNALTVSPNGSEKINGGEGVLRLTAEGQGVTFVYIDSTVGWRSVQENEFSSFASNYMVATGGTITTSGDYKIHTFTGPGTFTVCSTSPSAPNNIVDYLVVAGGGGGGALSGNSSGGGGGGGFRFYANTTTNPQTCAPAAPINNFPSGTAITVTATGFPITVGGGGGPAPFPSPNTPGVGQGSNSIFSTITSTGGGGGGMAGGGGANGLPGGSGGGATGGAYNKTGGSGNTPPVSPSQGNNGGGSPTSAPPDGEAGGGGGAMAVGGTANVNGAGPGGAGGGVKGFGASGEVSSCISYFSGGGAGGSNGPSYNQPGGLGGGGNGGPGADTQGQAGTANTGGGGGGYSAAPDGSNGSAGGSGIVVIRYRFQ
jgi:hypothetical protein